MSISFNNVPSNLRVPFVAVEIDNSNASQGPALLSYRGLLIGQKTSGGSATANGLYQVTSADQVATLAGRGSLLHRQAKAWFAANKFTETWIGVLADNGSGVLATGTFTFTGTASAAGTWSLYIGGDLIQVGVATGDTATVQAASAVAAINAATDLPVTAANTAGVLTVTAKNKGTCGNEIDLRVNYQDGESAPAGSSVAIVAMASGATNPTLTALIAALGDSWFQVVAFPYTDATSLAAIEAELADRFGSVRMIDGHAFAAKNDTLSNLATLGNSRNSPHVTIVSVGYSPTPAYEVAANVAAQVALEGAADPARPFQTLPLVWVKAPAEADEWTLQERNTLLYDGISTLKVAAGGIVQIERLITTYKTNAAGGADTSFLDVTTMLTLLYLRYSFRQVILAKYPRHKLADDGTRFGAGQAVITPKGAKAEAVLWFKDMESLGLVENAEQFKKDVVVERDQANRNRLNFLLPPDLINQFITGAVNLQFIL